MLEERGAALCRTDRSSRPRTPLWRTADWAYLRLHEGAAHPWPGYGDRALRSWVERLGDFRDSGDAHIYFNNDPGGAAVHDAVRFGRLANDAGWPLARTPTLGTDARFSPSRPSADR